MKIAAVIMLAGLCVAGGIQPAGAGATAARIVTSLAAWNRAQLEPVQVGGTSRSVTVGQGTTVVSTDSELSRPAGRCASAATAASVTDYPIGAPKASGLIAPQAEATPAAAACPPPEAQCGRMIVNTGWSVVVGLGASAQPVIEHDLTLQAAPGSPGLVEVPAPAPFGRPCAEAPHTWAPITEAA